MFITQAVEVAVRHRLLEQLVWVVQEAEVRGQYGVEVS
jgi:hypothetical protein